MLALCAGILQGAAAVPVERIYVSTDREVYVAGDAVWCSLTCLDGNGRFSNESAVSYLELVSEAGTACTAKIGLLEGRGAGSFRIPVTAPTGTYRLVAYTAVNAGEEGTPWMAGSRLLSRMASKSWTNRPMNPCHSRKRPRRGRCSSPPGRAFRKAPRPRWSSATADRGLR